MRRNRRDARDAEAGGARSAVLYSRRAADEQKQAFRVGKGRPDSEDLLPGNVNIASLFVLSEASLISSVRDAVGRFLASFGAPTHPYATADALTDA